MRLILVRHGITQRNIEKRYSGQTDIPLAPLGEAQVRAVGQALAATRLDAIYSSPLQRAWHTALAIAAPHTMPVIRCPGLIEGSFGSWEGATYAELAQHDPEALHNWVRDPLHHAPPGGESITAIVERVRQVLTQIRAEQPEVRTIVLVSHGGFLRVLLAYTLQTDLNRTWMYSHDPAAITEITLHPEGPIINRLNDRCHLQRLPPVS